MPHGWLRPVLVNLLLLGSVSLSPRRADAGWAVDGNPVIGTMGTPRAPVLVPGAGSSVLAAWLDGRTAYSADVRLLRMSSGGLAAPGWTAGGNLVAPGSCFKTSLSAISDGAGGALVAWSDDRCGGFRQIYASRVTADGAAAVGWPADGTRLAPTIQTQDAPVMASDGAGGAFVVWQDLRGTSADIYMQRVTATGAVAPGWPATGLPIAAVPGVQSAPVLEPDGSGGVYVAWQDRRLGNEDLYAQHVMGDGTLAPGWAPNGRPVCVAIGDQTGLRSAGDDAGGLFLAWQDARAFNADVYAVRLRPDGSASAGWRAGGSAVSAEVGDQRSIALARDGAGGILVAWEDHRDSGWDVYARRITAGGASAPGWPAGGLAVAAGAEDELAPALAADGAGGAFIAWQRGVAGSFDIHATRLAADGSRVPGWPDEGSLVCGAAGEQTRPLVSAAGSEAVVLWSDRRAAGAAPALFAQRLLTGGPIPVGPSGIEALHHDGQTFLTWAPPPDTGWIHRVYFRSSPIASEADLATATLLGCVGDSSATDRRLSRLTGTVYAFRADSAAAPLAPEQGLFVVTVPGERQGWYAVTSQLRGGPEDRRVVPGVNALASAVNESLGLPRPVYQRSLPSDGVIQDVYTLWTWSEDTPLFPAMSNRPSEPWNCGVTRGAARGPAFVRPHHRGGSFQDAARASGYGGEWVLALDDHTQNQDVQTWWYGHHPGYDGGSEANVPPIAGVVVDYTNRRALHTIRWWRRNFDLDTTRHYACGISLGGTYSLHLGLDHPELIVAALGVVGKLDFSFENDPAENSLFNTGSHYRASLARMWGESSADLPTTEGPPAYQMMNATYLAGRVAARGAAFLVNYAGRNDHVVGWAEKIPFYAALETHRLGGIQFWDQGDHLGVTSPGAFMSWPDVRYLLRFRSDLSWPAFSNCSVNGDPGDGSAATGDTLGTLNGHMEWEPALMDFEERWEVTLKTRQLRNRWGTWAAPESLTVDVTPRNVQRFRPAPGTPVYWWVVRLSDGALLQSGEVAVDALGLITVPAVKTLHTGTRLVLTLTEDVLDAPAGSGPRPRLTLAPFANPVRGRCALAGSWPGAGPARVVLYDASGRVARLLWKGEASAGEWSLPGDLGSLPPGIYHLAAEQGERRVTRRLALLR